MEKKMLAFIDSFELITILIDKKLHKKNKRFYLEEDGKKRELQILAKYEENDFYKYSVKFIRGIELHKDYIIEDEFGNSTMLSSGSVVRTQEFEVRFKYDGPLGFEYTKEHTTFRIWSPVAKEIILELHQNDEKTLIPLKIGNYGVWSTVVDGDLKGAKYLYHVRVFDKLEAINDPYALSSSTNGEYNYVIDISKFYKIKNKKPHFSGKYTDAIIYEASVRDFTCELESENQYTFLGMCENHVNKQGECTGLEYIKSLGVSHLQLLPTYDFGGVDDEKKDENYNWGYNPEQYFIPCGWYSLNPDDPYERINELLKLIDNAHELGLRVVMDVVFNHVYKCEFFAFDHLVPGYFYRIDLDGKLNNATGCGNVIATEKYMASRFVCDVLEYYARIFKVSGFRFDLMGLLDIETLNKASAMLRKIDRTIMLYGEGWNMDNPLPDEKRPHMFNHIKIPHYAFFNDRFRDEVRGSQWNKTAGFALGMARSKYEINNLVKGSCIDYYKFDEPMKTINYVECHDNYTMYDYARYSLGKDESSALDACRVALEMILISQGVPFIHAGEEFFRTKLGVENSYNARDEINKFDYSRRNTYIQMVNTVRDLIAIRKEYDVFRLPTKKEIQARVHSLDGITDSSMAGFFLEGDDCDFFVVIKNDHKNSKIRLENTTAIFDGIKRISVSKHEYVLPRPGVYIFKKEKENGIYRRS